MHTEITTKFSHTDSEIFNRLRQLMYDTRVKYSTRNIHKRNLKKWKGGPDTVIESSLVPYIPRHHISDSENGRQVISYSTCHYLRLSFEFS